MILKLNFLNSQITLKFEYVVDSRGKQVSFNVDENHRKSFQRTIEELNLCICSLFRILDSKVRKCVCHGVIMKLDCRADNREPEIEFREKPHRKKFKLDENVYIPKLNVN